MSRKDDAKAKEMPEAAKSQAYEPKGQAGGQAQTQKAPAPSDECAALSARLAEYENDLKRLAAEFDNYKKRVEKEKGQARQFGKAEALAPFLDMEGVFEKALSHAKDGKNSNSMREGLELLHRQLASILASNGVREIACAGAPNHAYHEVMLQVPGEPAGEIAQVLRKGYVMGEYVLRPAQVSVWAGEEKKEGKKEEEKEQKAAQETAR